MYPEARSPEKGFEPFYRALHEVATCPGICLDLIEAV
jgi:hypothetical protein